jgi:predicted nucleotidyltransferase component of viral defense system
VGHFLVAFHQHFEDSLAFKGGTCLRKCYFPDYRFSEDLDFTSITDGFELAQKDLLAVCQSVEKHNGIIFIPEEIQELLHQDQKKGYQVKIKYWGANHSKNQQPLPPERWLTRIKLEISTDELSILPPEYRSVNHPYTDSLSFSRSIPCYPLNEIISEKLRSLIQRSYTAPRDFYDIFHLTGSFNAKDWQVVKSLFLKKMDHKGLEYTGSQQLIEELSMARVLKAWKSSVAHQVNLDKDLSPESIIREVSRRIIRNL